MMKKLIALICTVVLIGAVCCGCSKTSQNNQNSTQTSPSAPEAETTAATQAAQDTQATQETVAAATQASDDTSAGALSEYVRTAKEANVSGRTLRLPEILLDSADAEAANSAIMDQYGAYIDDPEAHNYVVALDYEAYLNGKVLSVLVTGKLDGGNTFGQCYSFDVTTGSELSNEELCSLTGRDYNTAKSTLKTNLTSYYDDKYSNLPANDELRTQTLSNDNVNASVMYLGSSDNLMAMVNLYAAVGGGKWIDSIDAE